MKIKRKSLRLAPGVYVNARVVVGSRGSEMYVIEKRAYDSAKRKAGGHYLELPEGAVVFSGSTPIAAG